MDPNDGCDECEGTSTVMITRGLAHTCLMLVDGSVRCWGDGTYGQLGSESTEWIGDDQLEMPPAPIDIGGVGVELHAGGDFNCALLQNGELRCWGRNNAGQLGHGTSLSIGDEPDEMPPPPTDVGGPIAQIALGHSYGLCVAAKWPGPMLGQQRQRAARPR